MRSINKIANKINKASGGAPLADYLGGKLAKLGKNRKYVTETTTSKQALRSAGRVAATVGSLAVGGAISKAGKAAKAAKGLKVKHYLDYKGPAKIYNGRGNSIGRSGTSYKPFRK